MTRRVANVYGAEVACRYLIERTLLGDALTRCAEVSLVVILVI